MFMKKCFLILTTLCCFSVMSFGQGTFQPRQSTFEDEFAGLVYDYERAVDLRLHTNGYIAIAMNFGQIKTYYKTRYLHFEIGELRHHKERRQSSDSSSGGRSSRSYIFGKRNNLYALRGGIGVKRYFSEKAKRKGVAVGLSYEVGPVLGLLKPYYLELRYGNDVNGTITRSEKYSEENAAIFTSPTMISGASSFVKGFNELSVVPGGQFKVAVHLDWGAFDEFIRALEVGIMGDIFFKEMPIMVDEEFSENRPYFINLFVALQLGKRR